MLLPPLVCDPIFIGGEGRSGTTLMRVILDSHSGIACGPESHFLADPKFQEFHRHLRTTWTRRAEGFGYAPSDLDDLFRDFARGWFETYMNRQGKRRWADKTPQTIRMLPYLWELFPTARFIHMIRDGRDVFASFLGKEFGPKDVEDAAKRWVAAIAAGTPWRGDPRYTEVRYEELVLETEPVCRRVFKFLGEPWEPQVLEYHRKDHDWAAMNQAGAAETSKPPYTVQIGRWKKDLDAKQVRKYEKIAGPTLRALGYEVG
ncbi:MAG: sulfotransferase [Planctomycetes bacterium]|nr:sulfotransferase [Planctomycetota bacterium]